MRAKIFMEKVREAEAELVLISSKRRHFEELATMTGVNWGGVGGGSGGTSRVESAGVSIADLITDLTVKEAEYVALVKKAEELIAKIPQEKFRQVLTLYYLAGLTMRSVSDEMGYKDKKSVYHARGYALRELQKVM